MTDVSSTVLFASLLLFIGGALTALGIERIYRRARSTSVPRLVRKVREDSN